MASSPVRPAAEAAELRESHSFHNLAAIALDAVAMWPPSYIQSVLGPPRSWIPPFDYYSEFTIIDLWRLPRTLQYLVNVSLPSLPRAPLPLFPPVLGSIFWQPTEILQRPDYYDSYTSYPDEHWFFINGILTNGDVAQLNAAYLSYLFHRPITLVQNSTDGFVLDLLECSLGKEWYVNTESATKAFPAIYDALRDPGKKKVVVICHSQGTIIMACVLRGLVALVERGKRRQAQRQLAVKVAAEAAKATRVPIVPHVEPIEVPAGPEAVAPALAEAIGLPPLAAIGTPFSGEPAERMFVFQDDLRLDMDDFDDLAEAELAKLEIYAFANCATMMQYYAQQYRGRSIPWIENYGNENDLVARLGMLAPHAEERHVHVDGPCYVREGAWGHLLNEHYLLPLARVQKQGRKRGGACGALPFRPCKSVPGSSGDTPRLYYYINGGSPPPWPGDPPSP